MIERIIIKNYKCIKEANIELNPFKNIIVGNNGVGKSTLIEALTLALGYGKIEITPYIFNIACIKEYEQNRALPEIRIEVYFDGPLGELSGQNNSLQKTCNGLYFKVSFDELYQDIYAAEIKDKQTIHIPCEYYKVERYWFSQEPVRQYKMPYYIQIVDSSSLYFNSSSTLYINQLIERYLGDDDTTKIKTSLRHLKELFDETGEISSVNAKIQKRKPELSLSIDVTSRISKRDIVCPFLSEIPVTQSGAGAICHLKTLLSLGQVEKSPKSRIVIIEEPESHMSHTKMYEMLKDVEDSLKKENAQIILTTHNSYVANKLDLSNLIMLERDEKDTLNVSRLNSNNGSLAFFTKVCHYPTLRMILSKAVILVEGPADEMIVTYCYYKKYDKRHPFNDGIELIVVGGTAFKEYVKLLAILSKKVAVITDNDGYNKQSLTSQRGLPQLPQNIEIFTEENVELKTLEPCFVKANEGSLQTLSDFLRKQKQPNDTFDELTKYMINHKTEWSYKVLDAVEDIDFNTPNYIVKALEWVHG